MGQHTTTSPADSQQRFTNSSQLRGEELEVQKIQCPICLRAVPPTADAFLEPCFHAFCRECLKDWIDVEMAKDPGPELRCPVCRTPAEARIYSIDHDSFDRRLLPSTSVRAPWENAPPPATLPLTPQHLARRQAYSESCPAAQTDICCCFRSSPSDAEQDKRSSDTQSGCNQQREVHAWPLANATFRLPDEPTLQGWIKRELQALLLCDVPGTAEQVVTHTLRRTVHDRRKNKTGKRVPCSASDRNLLHGAVCSSMQLYLGTTNACKFACYLVSFISSAESVAAWDRTMRRPASTAHQRANCSAPVASSSQPISCAPDPGGGVRAEGYHDARGCGPAADVVPKHLLLGSTDDEAPSDADTDPG